MTGSPLQPVPPLRLRHGVIRQSELRTMRLNDLAQHVDEFCAARHQVVTTDLIERCAELVIDSPAAIVEVPVVLRQSWFPFASSEELQQAGEHVDRVVDALEGSSVWPPG